MSRLLTVAVAMVTVLGVLGVSPAASQEEERSWLAMGDSYSSGEGIPGTTPPDRDSPTGGPNSQGRDCRRATGRNTDATAWAVGAFNEVVREKGLAHLDFVACTGATTEEAATQIDEARRATGRQQWDLITFSFGGNDIGFVDVLKGCLDLNGWGVFDLTTGCDITEQRLRRRIDILTGASGTLTGLLDLLAANQVVPGGDVIVVGYPHLVEEVDRWDRWRRNVIGNCEGIQSYDVGMLRSVTGYLNEQIALAVWGADQRHRPDGVRFHFLDISQDPYEYSGNRDHRHALCSRDPWLNGATTGISAGDLDIRIGGLFHNSFHPHQTGHTETARVLAGLIWGNTVRFDDIPVGLDDSSKLSLRGLGPVEGGMSLAEAEEAAGVPLTYEVSPAGFGDCGYASPPPGLGLDEVSFMVLDGRIARADVYGPPIATVSGVRVGDPESAVMAVYGDQIRVEPHPYAYPNGHYMIVEPTSDADSGYRLIFETDGTVVTRMRSGLADAVDLIEGCA